MAEEVILREEREEIEGENLHGWYRKRLSCECGTLILVQTWTKTRPIGNATILKDNKIPNFCPMCGKKLATTEEVK